MEAYMIQPRFDRIAVVLLLVLFFSPGVRAKTDSSHMETTGSHKSHAVNQSHSSHGMSSGSHSGADAPVSVKVDFSTDPVDGTTIQAGKNFRVNFKITDSQSGKEVSQLVPAAWMKLRREQGKAPDQESCENMIKTFQRTGILTVPADVELNGFSILTVNADNSIGIFNPKVNLKTSNLKALIPFEGQPAQWALDQDNELIYLTLPEENKVVVIDLRLQKIKGYIEVGAQPRRMLFHRNSPYLWVGNDGSGTISVIDRKELKVIHTLAVGPGSVEIALDADGRFIFGGTSAEGRVSIFDIEQMKEMGRVTLGSGKLSMAYSSQRKALFVGHNELGKLTVIDPLEKSAIGIDFEKGIRFLTATPDGRYILALIPDKQKVSVIDASTHHVIGELPTEQNPDHIEFSPDYVYIRNLASPNITVVELSGLDNPATVPVAHVPIGAIAPDKAKSLPGISTMAPMHHGGHALIVNPADSRVYMYMEGMMAPMDSFKTYTSKPLGILLYDHALKEEKMAGSYESINVLDEPGVYDVPFYLAAPQTVECFELVVQPDPTRKQNKIFKPAVNDLFTGHTFKPGEKTSLRFELYNAEEGSRVMDINDIVVMSALQGAHWQHRAMANHLGEGLYEAEFQFPEAGTYYVLIEARSLGISFGELRPSLVEVMN
jgi:DNA-binding beta-propeller fold protein YncE